MSRPKYAHTSSIFRSMRKKDQGRRRAQLAAAARAVLLERGALGLRVKDVAARAGLAPSSVLYYYPDLADLLLEVSRDAMQRYGERRAQAVRELAEPSSKLRLAIHLGVPTGPDDEESRLLYELDALTGSSAVFATLSAAFFDRQVMLYESLLERGAEARVFELEADPRDTRSWIGRARGRPRPAGSSGPPGNRRPGRRAHLARVGKRRDGRGPRGDRAGKRVVGALQSRLRPLPVSAREPRGSSSVEVDHAEDQQQGHGQECGNQK